MVCLQVMAQRRPDVILPTGRTTLPDRIAQPQLLPLCRGCADLGAPETWTLPAVSRGLLYISQNERGAGGTKPRLVCYDLRGE